MRRSLIPSLLLVLGLPLSFVLAGCGGGDAPGPDDDVPPTTASTPCGVAASPANYNIPDYPCPPGTIDGWVAESAGQGSNFRGHAWQLFLGINQTVTEGGDDTLLWRTWPTSTDVFPGQYGTHHSGEGGALASGVEGSLALAALPGARLEHPAPGTPGRTDAELALDPNVDRSSLGLPNAPVYEVPTSHDFRTTYGSCLITVDGMEVVKDGKHFQNNGDLMVAGVVYDPQHGAASITSGDFWDAKKLDGLLPPTQTSDPTSIWMDDNSIVLKTMMWPVPGGADEYVALPQWTWTSEDTMAKVVQRDEVLGAGGTRCETYSGFERQAVWTDAAALTAASVAHPPATVSASYLVDGSVTYNITASGDFDANCKGPTTSTSPITYPSAEVASLDGFYVERFSEPEWTALTLCDKAIIDQSSIWAYGRPFDSTTDALALMAMHIMTKERTSTSGAQTLAGWTFQSAWWNKDAAGCAGDRKNCGGYSQNRPTASGPLDNYLITTTYGTTQKDDPPRTSWKNVASNPEHGAPSGTDPVTDDYPVAFNPYIELAATHPVETNCMNCHNRAAWPSRLHANQTHPTWKKSSYLDPSGPSTLHSYDITETMFKGLLTVDSMWAISDRAYYPVVTEGDSDE